MSQYKLLKLKYRGENIYIYRERGGEVQEIFKEILFEKFQN